MALAPLTTDFIGAIRTALFDAGMFRDQIVVLDPANTVTTPYDPITDTGGETTATVVLGPRAAYLKALSATVVTEAGILIGNVRYHVQFIPEAGDPIITKGLIVRVLEGGDNPALAHYAIAVLGSPTGSIAALTTLECQTSGTPSTPWTAA